MTENSSETMTTTTRLRVLSGMRPTGRLHLGNYMGALYNWVQLQHQYECYFFIADYHALTTDYADTSSLPQNIREVALDFLAAGLDPKLCTIFLQRQVPEHFELHTLLSMITPVSWLERVPTYKDQQEQLKEKELATYGFLGYPLLQSADILVYQAHYVPVGKDQEAHVEITREVARRFNFLFPRNVPAVQPAQVIQQPDLAELYWKEKLGTLSQGTFRPEQVDQVVDTLGSSDEGVLPEPRVLLTPSPKLPGLDGRKMSKSYGNTILLSDKEPDIRAKLKTMVTDPARVRRTDPGNPDICPVFDLHKVFSTEETRQTVREGCTSAGIGCIQCKGWLADAVVQQLAPIQKRRLYFETHPEEVDAILADGAERAHARAAITMREVRNAVGLR